MNKPVTKENIGNLRKLREGKNNIANAAPKAAPLDNPMMYGSANGFLNNPCIVEPAKDKEAPTATPNKILGNLRLMIIVSMLLETFESKNDSKINVFERIISITSLTPISATPKDKEKKTTSTKEINKEKKRELFFFKPNSHLLP